MNNLFVLIVLCKNVADCKQFYYALNIFTMRPASLAYYLSTLISAFIFQCCKFIQILYCRTEQLHNLFHVYRCVATMLLTWFVYDINIKKKLNMHPKFCAYMVSHISLLGSRGMSKTVNNFVKSLKEIVEINFHKKICHT